MFNISGKCKLKGMKKKVTARRCREQGVLTRRHASP
jgi:hypothetical protein